jgi:hypothetical protein
MELFNQIGGLAGVQVQLGAMNKTMAFWQGLYKAQVDENSKLISKIEKLENKVEQLRVENAELREHGLIK